MNKKLFILCFIFLTSIYALKNFDSNIVNAFRAKYGLKATKKLTYLDKIMQKAKKAKTIRKLKYINDFFNSIQYQSDIKHWGVKDYWATPLEFLGSGAGDCEDYAIAKYFTLIKVGIKENKLRIAYVKLLRKRTRYEEAHMVLLYFHKPNSTPIVLDNVIKRLKLATKRKDLKLIYSFNANGLWKAKNKGRTQKKVGANKLSKWKNLVNKI